MLKIAIPVLASVFLTGCLHESLLPGPVTQEEVMTPSEVMPSVSDTPMVTEAMMDAEVVEFTVEGSEFKFTPKVLNVKAGDKVRIIFKNKGKMMHDFRLDEFNAATKVISGGQEETIEFVAERIGTFEFYCSVNTHRQMGMVGIMNVR